MPANAHKNTCLQQQSNQSPAAEDAAPKSNSTNPVSFSRLFPRIGKVALYLADVPAALMWWGKVIDDVVCDLFDLGGGMEFWFLRNALWTRIIETKEFDSLDV